MQKTLASALASRLIAIENCVKSENKEWEDKHEQAIKVLLGNLPHGAGIDSTWHIYGTPERIALHNSYHCMNDAGYYDGWKDFKVIVKASLAFGLDIRVTGDFGKYADVKDYLHESMDESLRQIVED